MLCGQDTMLSERGIKFTDEILSCYNNLIMLFEQDDKLSKQDIKSFEQQIKLSERVKK